MAPVVIPGADHPKSGLMYSVRNEPPSHYMLKFDQFSLVPKLLKEKKAEKYESKEFIAGGYNWNLCLYPEGDKTRGATDHVSLYLALSKNNPSLKRGWELDVVLSLFVYNHNDNNYITVQDGKVWRLHEVRRECGFAKLLTLAAFKDVANGYLDRDHCTFGVEVFIIESQGKAERLSITEDPNDATIHFSIPNFLRLKKTIRDSTLQTVAGHNWLIQVYPNLPAIGREYIPVYQYIENANNVLKGKKSLVKYSLSVKDQLHATKWFDESFSYWG